MVIVDELSLRDLGHEARFAHAAVPYYDHFLRVLAHQNSSCTCMHDYSHVTKHVNGKYSVNYSVNSCIGDIVYERSLYGAA